MNKDIRHILGYVLDAKEIKIDGVEYDQLFICSSEVIDRSEEIIEQSGWKLDEFRRNPVMLACHQHRLADGKSPVIGSWPHVEIRGDLKAAGVTGKVLLGAAKFSQLTQLGKDYYNLYCVERHMKAVSVGFQPIKGERRKVDGRSVYVHTEAELIEISPVAVGCNQEALATLRQLGVIGGEDKAAAGELVDKLLEKLGETIDERFALIEDKLHEIAELLTYGPLDAEEPEDSARSLPQESGDEDLERGQRGEDEADPPAASTARGVLKDLGY
jgi:hypothetical protein